MCEPRIKYINREQAIRIIVPSEKPIKIASASVLEMVLFRAKSYHDVKNKGKLVPCTITPSIPINKIDYKVIRQIFALLSLLFDGRFDL